MWNNLLLPSRSTELTLLKLNLLHEDPRHKVLMMIRRWLHGGRAFRGGGWGSLLGVLARVAADRDVAERATFCPESPAGLAEVAWLSEVVVVVVAKLCVYRLTPWTPLLLLHIFHWSYCLHSFTFERKRELWILTHYERVCIGLLKVGSWLFIEIEQEDGTVEVLVYIKLGRRIRGVCIYICDHT